MNLKLLKISFLVFALAFGTAANAALIILDETDVFGTFLGNDADAADFMADTGITGVTELFRDESFDDSGMTPGTFSGTVTKTDPLAYLVVKFDGVYGVYDVMAYATGDILEWHTADFLAGCNDLSARSELNCGAATSHVTGYGVVPVPPAVWLFGSGLLGLVGIARRKA